MPNLGEWSRRVWYLLNRGRVDAALRREMEDHRAVMADPARFGNARRLREHSHDVWGWGWLDHLARDLRHATRMLWRTPGFTSVSVISLAAGFALTASTVAVLNAYLLRSLPYDHADRLYHVMYAPPGPWEPGRMEALDWGAVDDVVEFPITASGEHVLSHRRRLHPDHPRASYGPRADRRPGCPGGDRPDAGPSDFAAARTASRSSAMRCGAIATDRIRRSSAAGFGPSRRAAARRSPSRSSASCRRTSTSAGTVRPVPIWWCRCCRPRRTYMVRLREGVPPGYAEQRITQAARSVATGLPPEWSGVRLESAHWRYVGQLQPVLVGITVAAGARAARGLREPRGADGAADDAASERDRGAHRARRGAAPPRADAGRRGRLLCSAGLTLGMLLTRWLLGALAPVIETELGRPAPHGTAAIAVDGTVLLIVGGLGLMIALALPLLPLLTPWQQRLADALRRAGSTATDGRSVRHLRCGLIAFEVAGTLILFIGCGLLLRSAAAMLRTDLGFDADRLVRARIVLRAVRLPRTRRASSASTSSSPIGWPRSPMRRSSSRTGLPSSISRRSRSKPMAAPGEGVKGGAMQIGPGYFAALGIPLRAGREFTRADGATALPVAVVSETLARRLWPGESPLGRQIRGVVQTEGGSTPGPWRTVVGVAADVRQEYADPNVADFYAPITPASVGRFGSFYVRTDRPLASIFGDARAVAAGLDPHAVVDLPRTVVSENRQLAGTTFLTTMLTGFAAIAGFLAVLGIYGVTAYGVQQRQREIAIRMALGAPGGRVVALFLKEGAVVLAAGLAAGLVGAAAAVRVLEHQLFAVEPFDPATLAATSVLMIAAGRFGHLVAGETGVPRQPGDLSEGRLIESSIRRTPARRFPTRGPCGDRRAAAVPAAARAALAPR